MSHNCTIDAATQEPDVHREGATTITHEVNKSHDERGRSTDAPTGVGASLPL